MFQKWEEQMWKWCQKHNTEPLPASNEVLFICPRKPKQKDVLELESILPKGFSPYRFVENLKASTIRKIQGNFSSVGATLQLSSIGARSARIDITGHSGMKEYSEIWESLNKWLDTDGFLDNWQVTLNGEMIGTVNKPLDNEIDKNNNLREVTIGKDDILNLQITLGQAKTVDEFLESLK